MRRAAPRKTQTAPITAHSGARVMKEPPMAPTPWPIQTAPVTTSSTPMITLAHMLRTICGRADGAPIRTPVSVLPECLLSGRGRRRLAAPPLARGARGAGAAVASTGTAGAVLGAGDLEVAVDLHHDGRPVALEHVGLVRGPFGVGLDPLHGAAGYRRQCRRLDLLGGVTGQQFLAGAVLADVAALGGVELPRGRRPRRSLGRRGRGARRAR